MSVLNRRKTIKLKLDALVVPFDIAVKFLDAMLYASVIQTVTLSGHTMPDTLAAEHTLVLLVMVLPILVGAENKISDVGNFCKILFKHICHLKHIKGELIL